jgi:hypothetical protein
VAACLPLAAELLNRALKRHRAETATEIVEMDDTTAETAAVSDVSCESAEPTAEQRMWAYYVTERSRGRQPTGAELDRMAGTNNYGRRLLRRWRRQGRITAAGTVDRQYTKAAHQAVVVD